MSGRRDGITAATAGIWAALAGVLSLLGLFAWRSAGREYPQLPWLGLIPLGLYAVLVLYASWKVRQYVQGSSVRLPNTFQPTPQQARGTLVAAQAGALGGAMLVGFYGANALVHVSALDVESVRGLFIRAVVCMVGAGLVTLAGFAGQWMCRLPEDNDQDDDRRPPPEDDGVAYG